MADTQWPRFQVFLQEKAGDPFLDVGSVHAPDRELALLNARDVFVRRPECSALWVVSAEAIYPRTGEQLRAEQQARPPLPESKEGGGKEHRLGVRALPLSPTPLISSEDGPGENINLSLFYLFCKPKPAGTQTLVGQVEAGSPEEALQYGLRNFSGGLQPEAWWVVPAGEVLQNDAEDAPSLFGPALDKTFRLSTDFRTITAMRMLKTAARPLSPPDAENSPAGTETCDPGLPAGRDAHESST